MTRAGVNELTIFYLAWMEDETVSCFQERGLFSKQKLCSEGHDIKNVWKGKASCTAERDIENAMDCEMVYYLKILVFTL